MKKRFEGQVVLVTGASSGIGEALARAFASEGASLVLAARRKERLEALRAEIESAGGRALPVECDVTSPGDLDRVARAARERFGPIGIAVANAGFGLANRAERAPLEDYRRQFETNVFGVVSTFHAVMDDLLATRGVFVAMGSMVGYLAPPGLSGYAMTKYSVRAFAECLRAELASRGVAVVLVSPGFVESEIRRLDREGRFHEERSDSIPTWLRMPSRVAARKILRGIRRRRREIVLTRHARLGIFLSRACPGLVARVLARMARGRDSRAKSRER